MKLMRFLSAGNRGLAQGAPPMGRYRLPDGRVIPNFGGAKNPFTPKNHPSQRTSPPAAEVPAKAALTQAAPPSPSALQQPAAGPVAAAPVSRPSKGRNTGAGMGGSIKRLAARILAWRPRRRLRATEITTISAVRGPVQGELSLENVRVVRNDLNDSDFEVVCADTATASPVTLKRVPRSDATLIPPLGRLAERLFGAKTTE